LISGFNFSILATARITARAKEVAVRKVFGAKQSEVMLQFFAETFGQTLVAGLLAAGLSDLIIPIVETWFGPIFGNGLWGNLKFIGWLFLLILIMAFVSGFYPSFILGRLKPVTIFTSLLTNASKIESLRLTMVAIQIAVTACLIVVSTSMLSQYRFLNGQDLGFSPDGLVVLKVPDVPDQTRLVQSLYTRLRSLPSIDYLSVSSTVPGEPTEANLSVILPDQTKPIQIGFHMVSDTFFETYGVRQIAGMLFSEEFGKGVAINLDEEGSSLPVVVNASAVKLLGLIDAHKAIGQSIKTTGGVVYQIFGVMPDMRFRSLKEKARPELFILSDKPGAMLTVKQRGGDDTAVMDELETALQTVLPEHVVEVQFIQSLIDRYYESDRQNINVIISFSIMAILLSGLGFIATIHYAIDRQRRELAIRRIHGAQIMDLLMIFIKKLLKPILVANAIAFLISYYLVVAWLERFEKQWAIDIYPFLSATFIVLILTAGLLLIHVKVISRVHPSIVLHRE
jgi:putative ABC transport system permease protein